MYLSYVNTDGAQGYVGRDGRFLTLLYPQDIEAALFSRINTLALPFHKLDSTDALHHTTSGLADDHAAVQ